VLSPAAPSAQITPSPSGTEKQVKQMLGAPFGAKKLNSKSNNNVVIMCLIQYTSLR